MRRREFLLLLSVVRRHGHTAHAHSKTAGCAASVYCRRRSTARRPTSLRCVPACATCGWIEGDSIHLDFRTGERDELPALSAEAGETRGRITSRRHGHGRTCCAGGTGSPSLPWSAIPRGTVLPRVWPDQVGTSPASRLWHKISPRSDSSCCGRSRHQPRSWLCSYRSPDSFPEQGVGRCGPQFGPRNGSSARRQQRSVARGAPVRGIAAGACRVGVARSPCSSITAPDYPDSPFLTEAT